MKIEEALEKFQTQLEADGRSVHTRKQYGRHIRLLAGWARDVGPSGDEVERLDHEGVARFLASDVATSRAAGGQKLATSTNCLRSSLKVFLGHCHRAGYIPHDPGRLIRRARCSPPPPRALSDEDQLRLLSVLEKAKGPEAERDLMLVRILLGAGLRIGSAVALDVEDVDLDKSEILLRQTKGDRRDVVLLSKEVCRHSKRYIAKRKSGPLFTGHGGDRVCVRHAQRRIAAWVAKAGIKQPASAHSLRHAFAMKVLARTGDVLLVKEALRHRSIASTLVYVRTNETQLRAALA